MKSIHRFMSFNNQLSILFLITLLLSPLLLAGCASEKFETTTDLNQFKKHYDKIAEDKAKSNAMDKKIFANAAAAPDAGDYLLGPGDLIMVTVFETSDLNSEVRVSSRGTVSLPMLGNVDVYDLTAAEAEKKIEDLLRRDFLQDPHVTVFIKEHVSKQITLVGEVNNPGTYDYVARRSLLDVLAIADGLTEDAGTFAYITRTNKRTNERQTYKVDLDELISKGNMQVNMSILGGDVIFIPEAGHCFVDGAVRKPGIYPIKSNMTITEAIALAGGLRSYADDDQIKLIRLKEDGGRDVVSIDYSELQSGKIANLLLQDRDVIYAESSGLGLFSSGSGFSIGFMGTGINYHSPDQ